MKLFLDTSVLLAAAGSSTGASRAVFDYAGPQHWTLVTSRYCLAEVAKNLPKLPTAAEQIWTHTLMHRLTIVMDAVTINKPLALSRAKDKPVLITALAESCDYLLTLDRDDFAALLNTTVYGTHVFIPSDFLTRLRSSGRL